MPHVLRKICWHSPCHCQAARDACDCREASNLARLIGNGCIRCRGDDLEWDACRCRTGIDCFLDLRLSAVTLEGLAEVRLSVHPHPRELRCSFQHLGEIRSRTLDLLGFSHGCIVSAASNGCVPYRCVSVTVGEAPWKMWATTAVTFRINSCISSKGITTMAVSPMLGDPMGAGVCNRILRCSSRHTSLEHQAAELYKYLKQVPWEHAECSHGTCFKASLFS